MVHNYIKETVKALSYLYFPDTVSLLGGNQLMLTVFFVYLSENILCVCILSSPFINKW